MKTSHLGAAAPYAVLFAAAVLLYILAGRIEYTARPGELGPDFWPKLALGLMAAVSLFEIARALFSHTRAETRGIADRLDPGEGEEDAPRRPVLLVSGIALTVAYGLLIPTLGFPVATWAYLVLFMYLGGFRAHGVIWLSSLAGVAVLSLLFLKVVYVSLPRGVPPFDHVTDLIVRLF